MGGRPSRPQSNEPEQPEQPSEDIVSPDADFDVGSFPRSDGGQLEVRGEDGATRVIGYGEYGASAEEAREHMLFFHGTPGTRFFFSDEHAEYARGRGVRVIVPERGGFGLSTNYPGRTLQSSAEDARTVLDELGVEAPVYVVGYSAGGPVALAFAFKFGEQWCKNVAIVSSLSPCARGILNDCETLSKVGYFLARNNTTVFTWLVRMMASHSKQPAVALRQHRDSFTSDENVYYSREKHVRKAFAQSTLELYARRDGADAEAWDYILMCRDWGFRLEDIAPSERYKIWVYGGEKDNKCTPAMFRVLVDSLPRDMTKSVCEKDENHLFFYRLFSSRLFHDLGIV